MLRPSNILVPTDFSEYSDKALKQALDIARQYKARVHVLHVIRVETPHGAGDFSIPEDMVQQISNIALATARRNMQEQLEKFPQAREVEVISDIRTGLHYEEILKEAENRSIDLIVIASLGQSGIAKYMIGSVARNVLKGAKCPVLVTK
ncbi:MAG: hypothetical protein C0392_10710 [Syntrophus sp. (in: bacteria)]|nr:hypothetical protein [Syntrophus sp. (in: bacteria)]